MEDSSLAVFRLGLGQDTFANQTAVVTGAGEGIGLHVARALAWLGAGVVIAELGNSGAEAEDLIRAEGGKAMWVKTDVSDEGDIRHLAQAARQAFGPVDILVNNAIYSSVARVVDLDIEDWDRTMAVNLRGTFLTCKAFLPAMLERNTGLMINMVSTEAMPGLSAYIASKQGITGFSQSLAAEVGNTGVRVIAFTPGMVDTPGFRAVSQELAPIMEMSQEQFLNLSLHPAYPGLMPPDHAAAAAAYLAARLADEYHGEIVNAYIVLERCGLIHPAGYAPEVVSEQLAVPGTLLAPRIENQGDAADAALQLCQQLREIITQTEAEFNRLPIFIRPMARNGFKNKSGQSFSDWQRMLNNLEQDLHRVKAGEGRAVQGLQAALPRLAGLFHSLTTYYEGVQAETARFTRDADTLKQVKQVSDDRVARIRAFVEILKKI